MRRYLLLLFVAVALGALLGNLVMLDPGYVLISWRNATLETSVWVALAIVVIGVLLLRWVWMLLRSLLGGVGGLRGWTRSRRDRLARQRTTSGLLALAEGDWARARKALDRAAERVDAPLINHLGVARAAHEQGDFEARDEALQRALQAEPEAALAVGITRAELQINRQQWEPALATLLELRGRAPRNVQVLKLLRQVHEALGDWRAVAGLIDELQRASVVDKDQVKDLQVRVWSREFERLAGMDEPEAVRCKQIMDAYEALAKPLRHDGRLVEALALALLRCGGDDPAAECIAGQLGREWDEALVALYGRCAPDDPAVQLRSAEGWLKKHTGDAALLLALGRIALRNRQWESAREAFEQALAIRGTPEVCAELGRLCARLGEPERAAELLLEGARHGEALPELPLPEVPLPELPLSRDAGDA